MQTKQTCTAPSWIWTLIWIWIWFLILVFAALTSAEEDMEGPAAGSTTSVRQSLEMCAGEQEYVQKRKEIILEAFNRLGINASADSVPHIALLASGGGQRAAVALVGSLYQLEKDGLLDAMLYLGGVSGSTWSMASLYSDPDWSVGMDRAVSRLMGHEVDLQEVLAWLGERAREETFSLTDIWGALTSAGVMKQMDLRRLSQDASRNATNPYPVYCALEKFCFSQGPVEGIWFEVSPHEAGFTDLGLFVETSLLGSKFQAGALLEEKPEMDMVKLQGVLGCALADKSNIQDFIPHWLNVPVNRDAAAEEYARVYSAMDKLIDLTRSTVKDRSAITELDRLQKLLRDTDALHRHKFAQQVESFGSEERTFFGGWSLKLLEEAELWSQSLQEGAFKTQATFLTSWVLPLIVKWEWGTTNNFLYQYQNASVPECLRSKPSFHLVDAGLFINVAYPSFLGDKRDTDLILAPEYSAGHLFETLTLARDYAVQLKKPFPQIDEKILEEKEWPKDLYVFEGKEKEPTIVYLPLFNRQNCKDAEQVRERMSEFSTFQRPFSQEKIEFLLETAKENMKRNKEALLTEISKAVVRRRDRSC